MSRRPGVLLRCSAANIVARPACRRAVVFSPNTTAPVVGRSHIGDRPMIAFNKEQNETTWQESFVAMLPEIEQKLRLAFSGLNPEASEDAIEQGVVHSLLA